MERSYYALWFRLDGIDRYALWYSNGVEGIFLNDEGIISAFGGLRALQAYAAGMRITVSEEELVLHNLDVVQRWVDRPEADAVDCPEFLNAWNLFEDLARSAGIEKGSWSGHNKIYDKLFWGNNLPPVTPPGEHYVPAWTPSEVNILRDVLQGGLNFLRSRLPDPSTL